MKWGLQMGGCRSSLPSFEIQGDHRTTRQRYWRDLTLICSNKLNHFPFRATRREGRDSEDLGGTTLTRFFPLRSAPRSPRTCKKKKLAPSRSGWEYRDLVQGGGRDREEFRLELLQAARSAEAASCGRHGGRLSERVEPARDGIRLK